MSFMAEPQQESLIPPNEIEDAEDWDDDEDYDEDYDEDIDAEAQEIARRLGEELWADISKANADRAAEAAISEPPPVSDIADPPGASVSEEIVPPIPSTQHPVSRKEEAVVTTMKAILTFVEHDPLAQSTLASTAIPSLDGANVLDLLQRTIASCSISKSVAVPLSQVLVSLARSESLFGTLRHSNAPAIQLDKGKRKREETDDEPHQSPRAFKRPYVPDSDLHNQIAEAVRVITHALGASTSQPLDPALVSSIRLQLHQVFLFAVTSSAGGGHEMHALQEISGLIQVIGVLSGIHIGQTPPDAMHHPHSYPNPAYPWLSNHPPPAVTDIGTAVYPCLIAGCRKIFSRLYSLRAHQRSHAVHRPYRCNFCPASFARNHDLKRHVKLHDRKAWKCGGCHKVFSRRDAIKRHKNGSKTRGPKSEACVNAEVLEVELDEEEGEDTLREERRAKLWNGIAINHANALAKPSNYQTYQDPTKMEEGEIQPGIIAGAQVSVTSLHGLLQAHVGNALGAPIGHPAPVPTDLTNGQATLASVIARAQLQNLPPAFPPSPGKVQAHLPPTAPGPSASPVPVAGEPPSNRTIGEANPEDQSTNTALPSLSMYGLSDEQTKMLEQAIASAASAAQAQAEAEAAMEEEEEEELEEEEEDYDEEHEDNDSQIDTALPAMTE